MNIFDTHAHLYFPAFENPSAEIEKCREAGVDRQVQIGCDEISSLAALDLAKKHEGIYCALGLHPCDVDQIGVKNQYHRYQGFENYQLQCHDLKDFTAFVEQIFCSNKEHVVAFGETGFDLHHRNTPELFQAQKESFLVHLELCAKYQKPIIIHNRDTRDQFLEFWREHLDLRGGGSYFRDTRIRGIVHCFGEDLEYARTVTEEFGLMIGIGGVTTYPKAEKIREAIKAIDLQYLVTETDAPFLPPQSRRDAGIKTNSPRFLPEVLGLIAQLKDMDPEECSEILYQNACELFGL